MRDPGRHLAERAQAFGLHELLLGGLDLLEGGAQLVEQACVVDGHPRL